MALSAESSEIRILGKVTQLLPPGNGGSGIWREAQSPTEPGRGAANKGNFYRGKETKYERSWGGFSPLSALLPNSYNSSKAMQVACRKH